MVAGCACINRLQIVNAGPIADNVRSGSGLMRKRKTRLNTTQGRHRLRYRVGNRTSPAIFQFQEPLLESLSRHKSGAHRNRRGYQEVQKHQPKALRDLRQQGGIIAGDPVIDEIESHHVNQIEAITDLTEPPQHPEPNDPLVTTGAHEQGCAEQGGAEELDRRESKHASNKSAAAPNPQRRSDGERARAAPRQINENRNIGFRSANWPRLRIPISAPIANPSATSQV